MRHLKDIESLSDEAIRGLLDTALAFDQKLQAKEDLGAPLAGRLQFNLFFENSTRTSLSFLVAARRMGVEAIHVPIETSSVQKGESLRDTVQTLGAQGADFVIMRAAAAGTIDAACAAVESGGFETAILNGGEGASGHPTQALLDAATLLKAFGRKASDGLGGLTIAIGGDLSHSRVAASCAELFKRLGATIHLSAPAALQPDWGAGVASLVTDNRDEAYAGADVVMALRVQSERFEDDEALDRQAFRAAYGLSYDALAAAKPGAFVMHPGPMNRGVEIEEDVAEDPARSLITKQVAMGVPLRMACLAYAAAL